MLFQQQSRPFNDLGWVCICVVLVGKKENIPIKWKDRHRALRDNMEKEDMTGGVHCFLLKQVVFATVGWEEQTLQDPLPSAWQEIWQGRGRTIPGNFIRHIHCLDGSKCVSIIGNKEHWQDQKNKFRRRPEVCFKGANFGISAVWFMVQILGHYPCAASVICHCQWRPNLAFAHTFRLFSFFFFF